MAEWLVEDLFVLHHLHLVWREQAYEMVNLAATETLNMKGEILKGDRLETCRFMRNKFKSSSGSTRSWKNCTVVFDKTYSVYVTNFRRTQNFTDKTRIKDQP